MNSPNPFAAINLNGDSIMRGVTLALPCDRVRDLLPTGLELGSQDVTPSGTHPVILSFNELFRAKMSFPTLLPSQTYHELTLGIPYSYLSRDSITPGHPGPYYFMPRLFLDNALFTIGGLLLWGFTKRMASFRVTAEHCAIDDCAGRRLTSLAWKTEADSVHRPIGDCPHFAPVRRMLDQPLISMVPASIGPFFVLSDFDKNWKVATVRPLQTVMEVDVEFVTGYPAGRYPTSDWSASIGESALGSYELHAPWRLSVAYPPLFSFRR
jgi:hypothetical protein